LALVDAAQLINDDFPTLGFPINPTSPSNCNSRIRFNFCPGSHNKKKFGYWFTASLKCIFHFHPIHHGNASQVSQS
jgi:hypothetical protein